MLERPRFRWNCGSLEAMPTHCAHRPRQRLLRLSESLSPNSRIFKAATLWRRVKLPERKHRRRVKRMDMTAKLITAAAACRSFHWDWDDAYVQLWYREHDLSNIIAAEACAEVSRITITITSHYHYLTITITCDTITITFSF